ncbi:MAG TPA: class I SAM-dependent methyltransferase [Gaiellaceae bacterium]|nr:class I SAM-dependent methyltransferase [Gaiellaceae bacterium]
MESEVGAPRRDESAYVRQNRIAWDTWARQGHAAARVAWTADELRWGLWDTSESEIGLVDGLPAGTDVVELGCGTAAISAWLCRRGLRAVGVDVSRVQLHIAQTLQQEVGPTFPLIEANAEDVPYDNESFDVVVSEYGASLWCDPQRWLPEANRLLRPGGLLVFVTNGAFLLSCTPEDGSRAGERLVRSYFGTYDVEFPADGTVEFHPTHGQWINLLRGAGFIVDELREIRPQHGAKPRHDFVSVEWARQWVSEEIWIARKAG